MFNVGGPGEGWVNVHTKPPSNLYVVTLSTVCDAILGKGKLVLARRPNTISLVLEVFISIPLWAAQVSNSAK